MTRGELARQYPVTRTFSRALAAPLQVEDQVIQTMPDVSPTKWHLAHTSWFFETFVLVPAGCSPFDPGFATLFNSYYNSIGSQHPRPARGLISRPTVAEVLAYREHVDRAMGRFLLEAPDALVEEFGFRIELGLNHEEQHQELILTDLKHVLATNPSRPAYRQADRPGPRPEVDEAAQAAPATAAPRGAIRNPRRWIEHPGGIVDAGWSGGGFAFDNESPRHRVFLEPFALGGRLVTCGEYLDFMNDGGYDRAELWLADGWTRSRETAWQAPLYWERAASGDWRVFTLSGIREVEPGEPIGHVSFFEADAYARWAGARLPREEEWEVLAGSLEQATDRLWQWTASPYAPYPGYRPFAGPLGEYNGKFMSNQMVLRGGSHATPRRHLRPTYRNFFPPEARWQFTGIRLAR